MTKRPDTGRAIVSPCPSCISPRVRKSSQCSDGGKIANGPDPSGGSMTNGASKMDTAPLTVSIAQAAPIFLTGGAKA